MNELGADTDPNDAQSVRAALPLLEKWGFAAWILLLLSSADPASAVNFRHEFRAQLKDEANQVIASAGRPPPCRA